MGLTKSLIEEGGLSLVNSISKGGYTPLHFAAYFDRHDILQARRPFHAAEACIVRLLASTRLLTWLPPQVLLEAGADQRTRNEYDYTALHFSAIRPPRECCDLLLADHSITGDSSLLNAVDKDGHTPLAIAIYHKSVPQVHALLRAGCDPNVKDRIGGTLLHYCAEVRPVLSRVGACAPCRPSFVRRRREGSAKQSSSTSC